GGKCAEFDLGRAQDLGTRRRSPEWCLERTDQLLHLRGQIPPGDCTQRRVSRSWTGGSPRASNCGSTSFRARISPLRRAAACGTQFPPGVPCPRISKGEGWGAEGKDHHGRSKNFGGHQLPG